MSLKCLSLSEINERGELVLSLKSDKLDTSQTMTREQLRYLVARGEFVLQKDGENAKNLPSGN